MITKSSADYVTHRQWLEDVVGGSGLVLCYTTALECLNLFIGYLNETRIDVYAKERGGYENINYRVRGTFDGLDIIEVGSLLCTSVNQTINDMLRDFDNIDEQSLIEALSDYYFEHNDSFDGLTVASENIERFNTVRKWAMECHSVS
jgi:hypothetical protein